MLHLVIELIFVVFDEFVHVIRDSRVKRIFFLFQSIFVGEHVMPLSLLPQIIKLRRAKKISFGKSYDPFEM